MKRKLTQAVTSKPRGGALKNRLRRQPAQLKQHPPHLFTCWDRVRHKLQSAKHIALFLDFDGTLTALRKDPDHVHLEASTRQLLRGLGRHCRLRLCFISGRRRPDLLQRIRVPGADYLGLHGLEHRGQALGTPKAVLQAKRLLAARLKDVAGIRIEDKNLCFTVHYRGVSSRNVRRARAILGAVLAPFGSAIRMLEGKQVWEILPAEARGKGVAVQDALTKLPGRVLPIYIGDDMTDEYAFAALPQGLTVRVGRPGRTKARYWLRNPSEVKEFLARLNAETRGYSPAKPWVPGAASRHRSIGVPRLPRALREVPNSMTGGDS